MEEQHKLIDGYSIYKVSNLGNVKNIKSNGVWRTRKVEMQDEIIYSF